jgi:hypothetical protein
MSAFSIGSLNLIGNSYNPFEFYPSEGLVDIIKDSKIAENHFFNINKGHIKDLFKNENGVINQDNEDLLNECLNDCINITNDTDKFFDSGFKLSSLKGGMSIDNKTKPRLNPIVFCTHDNNYNDTITSASILLSRLARARRILNTLPEKQDGESELEKKNINQLKIWDLICYKFICNVVQDGKIEFLEKFLEQSPLINVINSEHKIETKKPKNNQIALLKKILKQQKKNSFLLGCQEMPHNIKDVAKSLNLKYKIKIGAGTGIICSKEFNVEEKNSNNIIEYLNNFKYTDQDDEVNKSVETTNKKLSYWEVKYKYNKVFYVVVLHCKSFKNGTNQREYVDNIIKKHYQDFPDTDIIIIGDMNYDSIYVDDPERKIKLLDKDLLEQGTYLEIPENYSLIAKETKEQLKTLKHTIIPEKHILTTIKKRSPFQGQPDKADSLTLAHKENIIFGSENKSIPDSKSIEIIGIDDVNTYQPNKEWPTDHACLLVNVSINKKYLAQDCRIDESEQLICKKGTYIELDKVTKNWSGGPFGANLGNYLKKKDISEIIKEKGKAEEDGNFEEEDEEEVVLWDEERDTNSKVIKAVEHEAALAEAAGIKLAKLSMPGGSRKHKRSKHKSRPKKNRTLKRNKNKSSKRNIKRNIPKRKKNSKNLRRRRVNGKKSQRRI